MGLALDLPSKRFHDRSPQVQNAGLEFVEALFRSGFIDRSQDVEKLPSHWCVAGVRHTREVLSECFCVSVGRPFEEVAFELLVGWAVDADAGVPLGFAAALGSGGTASVGNGIAFESDRVTAAVTDLVSLLLLELMVAFGCQQHKPASVSDVLHVGEAATFAIGFLSLIDVDAVFGNQLLIEQRRIFAGLDSAGDVEPVAMPQIADGDLLD